MFEIITDILLVAICILMVYEGDKNRKIRQDILAGKIKYDLKEVDLE